MAALALFFVAEVEAARFRFRSIWPAIPESATRAIRVNADMLNESRFCGRTGLVNGATFRTSSVNPAVLIA